MSRLHKVSTEFEELFEEVPCAPLHERAKAAVWPPNAEKIAMRGGPGDYDASTVYGKYGEFRAYDVLTARGLSYENTPAEILSEFDVTDARWDLVGKGVRSIEIKTRKPHFLLPGQVLYAHQRDDFKLTISKEDALFMGFVYDPQRGTIKGELVCTIAAARLCRVPYRDVWSGLNAEQKRNVCGLEVAFYHPAALITRLDQFRS